MIVDARQLPWPSRTIETFENCRWFYSCSHFCLSSKIEYIQLRSCQTGSWCKLQKEIWFRWRGKGVGEEGGGGWWVSCCIRKQWCFLWASWYICMWSCQTRTRNTDCLRQSKGSGIWSYRLMWSAKNVLDDIEKDDTDATGQKEVMGGSVQVENRFSHDNI